MPARQPFTVLCQQLSQPARFGCYDLHIHTTHSDGQYTPPQILDLARRCGLAGLAVTDHDTLAGVAETRAAALGSSIEVIPGVEITAEFEGREQHLLGYFFRPDDQPLGLALDRLRAHRRQRFGEMVERLRLCGVPLDDALLPTSAGDEALGRRHLAMLLMQERRVGSIREAFARYLGDNGRVAVPKLRLAADEAISLIHAAGGVAAWAHPPYDCKRIATALAELGLDALEIEYPGRRTAQVRSARALAASLGLNVSGGSDCHGPEPAQRTLGIRGIRAADLELLRRRAEQRELKVALSS